MRIQFYSKRILNKRVLKLSSLTVFGSLLLVSFQNCGGAFVSNQNTGTASSSQSSGSGSGTGTGTGTTSPAQPTSYLHSYYTTQAGAGQKNGSSLANAWSLSQFNATTVPTAGDVVYFTGSFTAMVIPNANGKSSSPLTLDFTQATLASPAFNLSGNSYLTLLGGSIATDSGEQTLITCTGSSHDIVISGFTFTGAAGNSGTDDFIVVQSGCNNWTVQNNKVDNVESFFLAVGGALQNIQILNNYARSSTNTVDQTDVIFLPDAVNVTIEGNKLVNQSPGSQQNSRHNDVIQTFRSGSSLAQSPSNWTIRYNWIDEAAGSGGDGSNSWTMMEGMDGSNAIYANVFVGDGTSFATNGIAFDSNEASVVVYLYNNTFVGHGTPGNTVRFLNSGTLYARNNVGLLENAGTGTFLDWAWSSGAAWNDNFFYGFSDCGSSFTGSHGSCTVNPLFTNDSAEDFSLQSSSPLRNVGDASIGSTYNQGIASGASWPHPSLTTRTSGAWDVGAYQH